MTHESTLQALSDGVPGSDDLEVAADAVAFVQTLHDMFKTNGMTTKEEPDLDELESLFDAVHGELAAACIFLSETSFARVPDMLRAISRNLETANQDNVPPVVVKGFTRLAQRIENTRAHMQVLAQVSTNSQTTT